MEMWLGGGHVKQMRIALGCPVVPTGDAQLCLVRMNPIFVEGVNAGLFVRAIRKKKKKVKSLRRLNVGAATRPHLGAFSGQHKAAPLGITRRHGESCEKEGFFLSGGEAKKSDTSIISDISLRNLNMNAIKKKEKKTLPPCVRASLVKGEDVCGRCYGAVVLA